MFYLRFKIQNLRFKIWVALRRAQGPLVLVRGLYFAFDAQGGFGGVGVRHDGEVTALETVMARAVVGHLDAACLARGDRLAGIVAHGATAT